MTSLRPNVPFLLEWRLLEVGMNPDYPEKTSFREAKAYSPVLHRETRGPEWRLVHMHRGRRAIVFKAGLAGGWRLCQVQANHLCTLGQGIMPSENEAKLRPSGFSRGFFSDLAPKLTFTDMRDPKVTRLSKREQTTSVKFKSQFHNE